MQKKLMVLIMLTLLLASCNLPTNPQQVPPTGTPAAVEMVSTVVAATLTARPSATTRPSQTSTLEPTATNTPTPQASATLAPSATQLSGDLKSSLGQPAWKNELNDGKAFGLSETYTDDNTQMYMDNGSLVMVALQPKGWRSWRLTSPAPQDFYLEGTFRTSTCAGKDQYGLVFRAPDYDSGFGYYLTFTCDGSFTLIRWDDNGEKSLFDLERSSEIKAGSDQTNRMGVWAKGDEIKIYANGKEIKSLSDSALSKAGHIGAFITAYQTANYTLYLDDIAYWNLP